MQPPEREIGMLKKHRDHIRKNLDQLVKNTDYSRIATECVRQGILSTQMLRNAEDLNGDRFNMEEEDVRLEQHRKFFLKIIKRGPTAYNLLIIALRNVNCGKAAELLASVDDDARVPFISISERKTNNRSADIVDTKSPQAEGPCFSKKSLGDPLGPLTPYTEPVEGKFEVTMSTMIHADKLLGTYPMQSRHNRGVLFMVNIIDFQNPERRRNGAELDSKSLIHVFRLMGFIIFAYDNMNQQQFFDVLRQVTSSSYAKATECFVMVLMTHGNRVMEIDKVEFRDGSVADTHIIKSHFQANVSPYLVNKPKVLIFPTCRGEQEDKGHPNNQFDSMVIPSSVVEQPQERKVETEGCPKMCEKVPTLSDTLVCHANTPGYVTHRDSDKGSWYIQKLCALLAKHAHDTHLEDILKMTNAVVGSRRTDYGSMQTGAFENLGFNKKLYFNPGFYKE